MVEKVVDKEELVGQLFVSYVSPEILGSEHKKMAVERYLRSYLRGLTKPELEFELKYADDNSRMSSLIRIVVNKASRGYDRFMAKRGKARV